MSRKNSKQRGVSLVEVMLTLALSSLLLISILAGRNGVRSQALFSDGMERIKETVLTVKSQANTSNSTAGQGSGVSSGTLKYYNIRGRAITFVKSSSTITIQTVLCYANTDHTCMDATQLSSVSTSTLPSGITYDGTYTEAGVSGTQSATNMTILFTRSDDNGDFTGAWYPNTLVATALDLSNISTTGLDTTYLVKSSVITLNFSTTDGRKGTVIVDPYSGSVTRQIL